MLTFRSASCIATLRFFFLVFRSSFDSSLLCILSYIWLLSAFLFSVTDLRSYPGPSSSPLRKTQNLKGLLQLSREKLRPSYRQLEDPLLASKSDTLETAVPAELELKPLRSLSLFNRNVRFFRRPIPYTLPPLLWPHKPPFYDIYPPSLLCPHTHFFIWYGRTHTHTHTHTLEREREMLVSYVRKDMMILHWKYGLKGEREIKHIHTPTNPQRHAQPDSHPPIHPHTQGEDTELRIGTCFRYILHTSPYTQHSRSLRIYTLKMNTYLYLDHFALESPVLMMLSVSAGHCDWQLWLLWWVTILKTNESD